MISRLSALAALFAVVATTSLAYAANVAQQQRAASIAGAPTDMIAFPAVQVIGKRSSIVSN